MVDSLDAGRLPWLTTLAFAASCSSVEEHAASTTEGGTMAVPVSTGATSLVHTTGVDPQTTSALDGGSDDGSDTEAACECVFTPPCDRSMGCSITTGSCPSVCPAWEQELDDSDASGRVRDLAMTPEGNILVVGQLEHLYPEPTEAFVAYYTADGRELWRVAPPVREDTNVEAVSVATDSGSGAVILYQIGIGVGEPRTALFSLDGAGETRWVNDELSPSGSGELGWNVAMAPDDSFFVEGNGAGYWVRRFSADGSLSWESIGDPAFGDASAWGMTVLADGGLLLLGSTIHQPQGEVPFVGRLSPDGAAQWAVVDAEDADRHWQLGIELDEGDLLLFGNQNNSGYGLRVARFTADGEVVWRRESSGSEGCMGYAWSIASASNRVFVLGWDEDPDSHRRVCLQEIDCDGHPRWQLTHSELGSDFAGGIAAHESHGLAISGGLQAASSMPSHPWIAVIDVDEQERGCRAP